MTHEAIRNLFDNFERVWNEDQHGLIADCLADVYVRHDGTESRRLTPEQYVEDITIAKQYRPGTRVVVYDHVIAEDRAWFRFGLTWHDATKGGPRSRAGIQVFRIERGKLSESWLTLLPLGSSWPDETWQEHWTGR